MLKTVPCTQYNSYQMIILILGNGGVKKTRTYDEDDALKGYVITLQNFDRLMRAGVKDGTISVTENIIETDKTFDL